MFVKDKIAEAAPTKSQYQRYEDPMGDFGSKQLKYSLWFVQNKVLLYRIALGLLIAISAAEWLYSIGALVKYAAVGYKRDQALNASMTQFIDYTKFYAHTAPQNLAILNTQVLPGGVHKFDAVSEVVNPNEHFAVEFDYYFMIGGVATERVHTTLMAGDDRLLPVYGISSDVYPGEATLVIENIAWKRIAVRIAPTPKNFQGTRLNFEVKNFEFVSALSPESARTNVIRFDYFNNTGYSYQEPKFVVGLYYHQAVVGVLPLVLPQFATNEKVMVDLRSFVENLTVDEIKVFPVINVYDEAVYLPPPTQ